MASVNITSAWSPPPVEDLYSKGSGSGTPPLDGQVRDGHLALQVKQAFHTLEGTLVCRLLHATQTDGLDLHSTVKGHF